MKYLNDVNYKDCVGKVFKSLNSGDLDMMQNECEYVEVSDDKTD